jgi:competence protein ComEA
MKAKIIALVLSLFVVTLPAQAAENPNNPISDQQTQIASKVDLNKADVATLTGSFKGIGRKRAEAIVAYRESHQGIKSIEEFAEIKGFGQRFVDKNREKLKEVFTL